ncbi:MAG: hypothetical protein PHO93_01000 [Candidatus Saccharimonadaceae bacterium]|nr:hypothetical protein [Candidatus Saccharimonadaceae bacterium]
MRLFLILRQDLAKRGAEKKAPAKSGYLIFKQAEESLANLASDDTCDISDSKNQKCAGSNPATVGQNKIPISR